MPPSLGIVSHILTVFAITATAVSATSCSAESVDCLLENLGDISLVDLLSRMSETTQYLTVRGVNITDRIFPQLAGTRARQLVSIEFDRVSQTGTGLQGGEFTGLGSVRIRGSGGPLCPFAESIEGFAKLQAVIVSDCRLSKPLSQAWLRDLPMFYRLIVNNAKVDSLHLGDLDAQTRSRLTDIQLNGNSFNTLADDAFGNMSNLVNLTLDGNIIQYIQPGAFAQLPNLKHLSITLPKEGQLAKIWETSLDGRFDKNTKLESLRLVNARLAEDQIPKTFDQLKQLRILDLSGNRFRRLQNSVLSSLSSLEELDLSNGSLICIHDRNFGVMNRLRRLNLANNEIRVLGRRAFLGLSSLRSLDLAGNPVESIEPGAFCTLRAEIKDHPALLSSWAMDPARIEGSANVSEICPADFNPHQLILSSKPQCPTPKGAGGQGNGSDGVGGGTGRRSSEQSRHTFLIIIGLCVAFLLITIISMMAYKGWSKRKNAQLAKDEEKELELQAMVAAAESGATNQGASVSSGGSAGGKKPQNGRQHRQHHHHHQQQQQQQPSNTTDDPAVKKADSATEGSAEGGAEADATMVETTVQVESPERCGAGAASEQSAALEDSPSTSSKPATSPAAAATTTTTTPQMRPGITPMTTVPEDSDLEARAITTLVVI